MEQKMDLKKTLYKLSNGFTILPLYLAVNITNVCNRKCNFCTFHSPYLKDCEHYGWFKKQPNNLNLGEFTGFLNNLGIMKKWITHVSITGKGEPLLHPYFYYFCDIIEYHEIPFTITTNGDFLTDDLIEEIIKMRFFSGIRISLYDEDSVMKWKGITDIHPKITLFNQTGIHIKGIEDGYSVQIAGTEDHCTMPKDFNRIEWCKAPWSFLTINTDGSVVPCYSFHEIGNIEDHFLKIWNGKKIRAYRRSALTMSQTHSDCLNCGIQIDKFK